MCEDISMKRTMRHFFLVVFCQNNFLWRSDSDAFFSGCLLSEFFLWRRNSEVFFSFCLLSTWGWEHGDGTVWQFFFAFARRRCPLPFPVTVARHCCPFLWVPVFYIWRSKHLDRSLGGEVWGREHGTWGQECGDGTVTQIFSVCVLSKIFFYGDGKMTLWFSGCLLSKKIIAWFVRHCCLLPLPISVAHRLCQSTLPVAVRCCCSFLWVLVFYIWRSNHFNRSVGREAWGCKHGTDN